MHPVRTTCAECGTHLWGVNLHRIGELYYCSADFQRLSPEEEYQNQLLEIELDNYKSLFDGTGAPEKVINGDFATSAVWTTDADVTITGGEAVWTNALNGTKLTQTGILDIGVRYVIIFIMNSFTDGGAQAVLGGVLGTNRSAAGTYTETIQAGVNKNLIIRSTGSGAAFSINNISVRREGK